MTDKTCPYYKLSFEHKDEFNNPDYDYRGWPMCILFYDRCDKMLNTHQTCPRFLREKGRLRHNALEDAVQQAKEFYTTLVHMRQHNI